MEQQAYKGLGAASDADAAFESLFTDLENDDPDVRAEASRLLADVPNARRKLICLYQGNLNSNPRKSILAGRVLGRKISAGGREMIHAETSSIMFGIEVAFAQCTCGHCGRLNVGIFVPEGGLYTPFYSQRDDKNCVYVLPVLCDFCGKQFFIAWDSDPREPRNRT